MSLCPYAGLKISRQPNFLDYSGPFLQGQLTEYVTFLFVLGHQIKATQN